MPIARQKITEFNLLKGRVEDTEWSFQSFIYVKPCDPARCYIAEMCTYEKSGTCSVERQYLMSVFNPMNALMQVAPDPFIIHWIGTHILPAYHTLIKFKKRELSLRDVIFETKSGDLKGHPIYKMINDQEKVIIDLWTKSGIFELTKKAGFLKVADNLLPTVSVNQDKKSFENGQDGYYEQMSQGEY